MKRAKQWKFKGFIRVGIVAGTPHYARGVFHYLTEVYASAVPHTAKEVFKDGQKC